MYSKHFIGRVLELYFEIRDRHISNFDGQYKTALLLGTLFSKQILWSPGPNF